MIQDTTTVRKGILMRKPKQQESNEVLSKAKEQAVRIGRQFMGFIQQGNAPKVVQPSESPTTDVDKPETPTIVKPIVEKARARPTPIRKRKATPKKDLSSAETVHFIISFSYVVTKGKKGRRKKNEYLCPRRSGKGTNKWENVNCPNCIDIGEHVFKAMRL